MREEPKRAWFARRLASEIASRGALMLRNLRQEVLIQLRVRWRKPGLEPEAASASGQEEKRKEDLGPGRLGPSSQVSRPLDLAFLKLVSFQWKRHRHPHVAVKFAPVPHVNHVVIPV
eukprot:238809-Rhodomonas_salina.1